MNKLQSPELRSMSESDLRELVAEAHALEIAAHMELARRASHGPGRAVLDRPPWVAGFVQALDGSPGRRSTFSPRMVMIAVLFALLVSAPSLVRHAGILYAHFEAARSSLDAGAKP
jgi:hypothetical protein